MKRVEINVVPTVFKCVRYCHRFYQGLLEEGSAGTSVRDPERQEWACESLKGPIALVMLFFFFLYFQLFLVYLEN